MRIHSREVVVNLASADLRDALSGWLRSHEDLTTAEVVSVVTDVLAGHVMSEMRYEIRMERHGTVSVAGGEAHEHEWVHVDQHDIEVCAFCDATRYCESPDEIFERDDLQGAHDAEIRLALGLTEDD